ncbi:MAG: hypothetical protein HC904_07140 [Blastochloris sp.]|nr:hypothetical protein [Blastochloris sp.]
MTRNAKSLTYNALHYQVASLPTFSHLRTVGDPRFTYLSNYDWGSTISGDSTYGSSTYWKGRNRDAEPYNQNFVNTWAARDYVRANPVLGATPGGITSPPDSTSSPYIETIEAKNAPLYIRNSTMLSIAELGNIFDPIQSDNTGAAPSGGSPSSIFVAGGGRSLRIGQPEFTYLNTTGRRAMELLDLFTVNPALAASDFPKYFGRININTAGPEVLQALFYNIEIKSDEGFHQNDPAKISKLTEAKAKLLADAIIKNRQDNGYYTKLSDLYRLFTMTEAASSAPAWNRAETYQPNWGQIPLLIQPLKLWIELGKNYLSKQSILSTYNPRLFVSTQQAKP